MPAPTWLHTSASTSTPVQDVEAVLASGEASRHAAGAAMEALRAKGACQMTELTRLVRGELSDLHRKARAVAGDSCQGTHEGAVL